MSIPGEVAIEEAPRAHLWLELLGIHQQLLLLLDIAIGVFFGYFTNYLYGVIAVQRAWLPVAVSSMPHVILISSIVAALLLQEPLLDRDCPRRIGDVLAKRATWALTLLLFIGLATRALDDMARLWIVAWCTLFAVWVVASRLILLSRFRRLLGKGLLRETVAVVGGSDAAVRLAARVAMDADVVAIFETQSSFADDEISDSLHDVLELARTGAIDTVLVSLDHDQPVDVSAIVEHLKSFPVQIAICPDLAGLQPVSRQMRMVGGVPLAVMADRPIAQYDLILKGLCDRVGAVCVLVLLAPMLIACALAIGLESPGPIIFRQRRSGWGGRMFTVYKFRTMHATASADAGNEGLSQQTQRSDLRCTRIGALLRRTSVDELPQLWNVLLGNMSLVGPRPHADAMHVRERAGCAVVAAYAQRQRVKPGMTGWAQVNGSRGAITTSEQLRQRVEYDLYYIDHWSLLLDLRIILRTPLSMLFGENAF